LVCEMVAFVVAGELADIPSVGQPVFCPRLAVMFRSPTGYVAGSFSLGGG